MLIVMSAGCFLAGLALGLFTFRERQRWCSVCGVTLACPLDREHQHFTPIDEPCTDDLAVSGHDV